MDHIEELMKKYSQDQLSDIEELLRQYDLIPQEKKLLFMLMISAYMDGLIAGSNV